MMPICNAISDTKIHLVKSVGPILFPNDGRQPYYLVNLGNEIIVVFCSIFNGSYHHGELVENHRQLTQKLNTQLIPSED